MSAIFLIDGDFVVLDKSCLRKGSIEACGEKCNLNYFGAAREALFCEGGYPKAMEKEVGKWRDGLKTIANQKKIDKKKKVVLANGKEVEVNERPQRTVKRAAADEPQPIEKKSRVTKRKSTATAAKPAVPIRTMSPVSMFSIDGIDGGDGALGVKTKPVGKSRKEQRREERRQRESTPSMGDEDEAEENSAQPASTAPADMTAGNLMAAIHSLGQSIQQQFKKVDQRLEQIEGRIDKVEDSVDEMADTLEQQRALVREVATATPAIAANAKKAASGTDTITELLPTQPPAFRYRYLTESTVRSLDTHNPDFLTFAAALNDALFTEAERRQSLVKRNQGRVDWMTECLLYRRRFSVGGGKDIWIAAMRKRLNTYASNKRDLFRRAGGVEVYEEEEETVSERRDRQQESNEAFAMWENEEEGVLPAADQVDQDETTMDMGQEQAGTSKAGTIVPKTEMDETDYSHFHNNGDRSYFTMD